MAFGCLASLVLYAAIALAFLQPALLPVLALFVLILIAARAIASNPNWPVY